MVLSSYYPVACLYFIFWALDSDRNMFFFFRFALCMNNYVYKEERGDCFYRYASSIFLFDFFASHEW
jgi:hypothetical protein